MYIYRDHIIAFRERFHIGQKMLADLLGVSRSFISKVENGTKPVPAAWSGILEIYQLELESSAEKYSRQIELELLKIKLHTIATLDAEVLLIENRIKTLTDRLNKSKEKIEHAKTMYYLISQDLLNYGGDATRFTTLQRQRIEVIQMIEDNSPYHQQILDIEINLLHFAMIEKSALSARLKVTD